MQAQDDFYEQASPDKRTEADGNSDPNSGKLRGVSLLFNVDASLGVGGLRLTGSPSANGLQAAADSKVQCVKFGESLTHCPMPINTSVYPQYDKIHLVFPLLEWFSYLYIEEYA